MKQFRLFAVVMASLLLFGCATKDDISKLYDEIDALKVQIGQMNTNISSIQTVIQAVQDQDCVTSVTPIMRDGAEIGYTITFQHSGAVTVYNGADGANGKDGKTPVIGVSKSGDDWYWTLDGVLLKDDAGNPICATGRVGADGKPGAAGQPGAAGKPGAAGQAGANGKDGVTPQLKIEDSCWYVSYDNGDNWNWLGEANAAAGIAGDAVFKMVDVTSSDDYVRFVLSDGSELNVKRYADIQIELEEKDDIEIWSGLTRSISYKITGTVTKPKVSVTSSNGWIVSINRTGDMAGVISVTAPAPYADGEVTVLASEGSQTAMEVLTFKPFVEAVDLGLSVKWASCNVGAWAPDDYCSYLAWGESVTKRNYAWSTYELSNATASSMKKYCLQPEYGTVDNLATLQKEDDVANLLWGGKWRIPTKEEFEELIENCTWTWVELEESRGYRVTSKIPGYTDRSIFLTARGSRDETNYLSKTYGYYWSSTLHPDYSYLAYGLNFSQEKGALVIYASRAAGFMIRPVTE